MGGIVHSSPLMSENKITKSLKEYDDFSRKQKNNNVKN